MIINNIILLVLALFIKTIARCLNSPTSSKNIDKKVIEKNNNNILNGFIALFENKLLYISDKGIDLTSTRIKAPSIDIIQ